MMGSAVLIRDVNGNTLGMFDLPEGVRIEAIQEARMFTNGDGIAVTVILPGDFDD